jgi:hypothetical protein
MWGFHHFAHRKGSRVQANDLIFQRWATEMVKDKWLHNSPALLSHLGFEG